MRIPILIAILVALVAFPHIARGAPDLATKEVVQGLTVVRDRENPRVFYFFPGEIEIARRDDGGPDLALTLARYTGTVVHGDQGTRSIRPTFYAKVRLLDHGPDAYRKAARELSTRQGVNVSLKPIPVAKLDAELVYARAAESGEEDRVVAGTGFFEPADAEGNTSSMWKERDVFLLLDPTTAQLVENQLKSGSVGLTLAYSFFSRAWSIDDSPGELTTTGDRAAEASLEEALREATANATPQLSVIHSHAVPIVIPKRFRETRIRHYDIDTTYPPDYPSLIVYCFDFRDGGRNGLFEKTIEIEATGVAGGTTRYIARFGSNAPEVVAQTIRFRFAVDLRRPYRWRVEEIKMTGETVRGPWVTSQSWTEIVDASGPIAEARPAPP